MRALQRPWWIAAAVLTVACHRQSPAPGQTAPEREAARAQETATGVVRVVGAAPRMQVVLEEADGGRRAMVGPQSTELAQLVGAEVTVRGTPTTTEPPDTVGIAVTSYEILRVAGAKPIVGVLRRAGQTFSVNGTRLETLPPELAGAAGAKVWVVGRQGPNGLIVTAYGILAGAPRP